MKSKTIILIFIMFLVACSSNQTSSSTLIPTSKPSSTPTNTALPLPTNTPTPMPSPTQIGGGSGKLIFEYYKAAYEKDFPDLKGEVNIFISNIDGTNLMPITNGLTGINRIIRVSPDGRVALVWSSSSLLSTKNALYLINLNSGNSDPIKLTNEVDGQAVFLDNARVAYIGKGSQGHGIYVSNFDGTKQIKIGSPSGKNWTVVASDQSRVYWRTSQKENFKDASGVLYTYGDFGALWWTNLDGSGQGKLESNGQQIIPNVMERNAYAFSPDLKSVAWISEGLEPGCSLLDGSLAIWSPFIRFGSMTRNAQTPTPFFPENSPHFGKTIDIAYVENYVRQCFVIHVASLSDMDNDIKIPLIPPYNPDNEDFYYHKEYSLFWSPDSSKILAYDDGNATRRLSIIGFESYPLALYEVVPKDTNPKLTLLKVISNSPITQSGNAMPQVSESFTSFRFSPDGRLLLFVKWNPYTNFYSADVNILNLETLAFIDSFKRKIIANAEEKRVGEIFWIP